MKSAKGKSRREDPLRVHITTLGCSKNTYDSEILAGQLQYSGALLVEQPQEADAIIINTCGFITPAKQESIDAILEAEQLKQRAQNKKVIVCGCLAQRYKEALETEIPGVDATFGTEAFEDVLHFLGLGQGYNPEFLYQHRTLSTPSHYAYLKISEGCNHTCAFCAIPIIRGRHRSRPLSRLVDEARRLADQGVRELILIAQDTTFYGVDLYGSQKLVELLQQLESIAGLRWIRLHYLYPTTVEDRLIYYIAESEKVVPYLDMPVQHASDRMLQIMKRGGSAKRLRQILELARKVIPDVALRTSVIVGHPGEREEDFQLLVQFVKEMAFDRLGVFIYSHEEGTAAYQLQDLPQELKQERFQQIMALQQKISLHKNEEKIGRSLEVLIDEVDAENALAVGRTASDSPEIDNEVIIHLAGHTTIPGQFCKVNIFDASEYELYGKLI
ncbi:MAG: 30S ribosomal protein S12 methylthiotransferase RimO [Calditrichaeota bacterium]|nr:MAG: 30S ribosomal protein S12 methylthiotransferase RimO [Calditrichota bacterium]